MSSNKKSTTKARWKEIEDVIEPFNGRYRRSMISLSDADLKVAGEWCYSRNCGWSPYDFSHASQTKAWWECPACKRHYKATIASRTTSKSNCPYCTSKKPCSDNSLECRLPDLAAEWHPRRNEKLEPSGVTFGSKASVWWLCRLCQHSWKATVANRSVSGSACPRCYKQEMEERRKQVKVRKTPIRILLDEKTTPDRHWYEARKTLPLTKSHHNIAQQWHETKNGLARPGDFSAGSNVSAWWQCQQDAQHVWQAQIYSRTSGRGCPFCGGRKVCSSNSLAALFPQIAAQFHTKKNGKLRPDQIIAGSHKLIWWKCAQNHCWQASVKSRTLNKTGCLKCYRQRPRAT